MNRFPLHLPSFLVVLAIAQPAQAQAKTTTKATRVVAFDAEARCSKVSKQAAGTPSASAAKALKLGAGQALLQVSINDEKVDKYLTLYRAFRAGDASEERRCTPSDLRGKFALPTSEGWHDLGLCYGVTRQNKGLVVVGRTVLCFQGAESDVTKSWVPVGEAKFDSFKKNVSAFEGSFRGLHTAAEPSLASLVQIAGYRRIELTKEGIVRFTSCSMSKGCGELVRAEVAGGAVVGYILMGLSSTLFVPPGRMTPSRYPMFMRPAAGLRKSVRAVTIRLPRQPTSPVHCEVRATPARGVEGKDLVLSMVWEAAQLDALTQSVPVPRNGDYETWTVRCSSTPRMRRIANASNQTVDIDLAWQWEPSGAIGGSETARYPVRIPRLQLVNHSYGPNVFEVDDGPEVFVDVELNTSGRPSLSAASELLTTAGAAGAPRSLSIGLPAAVSELLSIIAEIALERGKAGAFELIRARLKKAVCADLRAKGATPFAEELARRTDQPRARTEPRLFPTTCRVVSQARLQDLMVQVRQLYQAVLDDLAHLATAGVAAKTRSAPEAVRRFLELVLDQAASILSSVIRGKSIDPQKEAQVLLVQMAQVATGIADQRPNHGTCGLALAFAVMSQCYGRTSCDARQVSDMLARPGDYFAGGGKCQFIVGQVVERWRDLSQLVIRGVDLLRTPRNTEPLQFLRGVLNWSQEVASKVLEWTLRGPEGLALDLERLHDESTKALARLQQMGTAGACHQAIQAIAVSPDWAVLTDWSDAISDCGSNGPVLEVLNGIVDRSAPYVAVVKSLNGIHCQAERVAFMAAAKVVLQPSDQTARMDLVKAVANLDGATSCEFFQKIGSLPDLMPFLAAFGRVSEGVLERDLAKGLAGALELVEAGLELHTKLESDDAMTSLRRASRILSAATGYALTYTKDETATPQELREKRKEAIESVIDAFTDRSERHGDFVVSFGVPVGLQLGGLHIYGEPPASLTNEGSGVKRTVRLADDPAVSGFWGPQLSLPVGFGFQELPPEDWGVGLFAFVYPIDLGQFLAWDAGVDPGDVEWNAFLSPGLQIGLNTGTPSQNLVFAVDVHYAPLRRNADSVGFWRVGFTVSYYVPLFDFN